MDDDKKDDVIYHLSVYGDVEIKDPVHGIILMNQNGARYRVTVNNAGALVVTLI